MNELVVEEDHPPREVVLARTGELQVLLEDSEADLSLLLLDLGVPRPIESSEVSACDELNESGLELLDIGCKKKEVRCQ